MDKLDKINRRQLASSMLLGGLSIPLAATAQSAVEVKHYQRPTAAKPLLWAAAWSTTSAEFGALCFQAFNLATLRVDQALEQSPQDKPLAVIADIDNTIFHAASYWGYLIKEGKDFFEDASWDRWIPKNLITSYPVLWSF